MKLEPRYEHDRPKDQFLFQQGQYDIYLDKKGLSKSSWVIKARYSDAPSGYVTTNIHQSPDAYNDDMSPLVLLSVIGKTIKAL